MPEPAHLVMAASPGRKGGGRSRTADPSVDGPGTRTCAGCGRRVEGGRDVLVRLVFGPDGELAIDSGEGTFGRATYVHPLVECVRSAGAKGVARRRPDDQKTSGPLTIGGAPLSADVLRDAVTAAYRRRLGGLVHAARRARAIAIGADAACAVLASGDATMVIVASDAAAAADRTEVRAAIAAGRAVSWGSKRELGELVGGGREDGVGVVAILDARIAAAMRDAVHVVDGLRGLAVAGGLESGL